MKPRMKSIGTLSFDVYLIAMLNYRNGLSIGHVEEEALEITTVIMKNGPFLPPHQEIPPGSRSHNQQEQHNNPPLLACLVHGYYGMKF